MNWWRRAVRSEWWLLGSGLIPILLMIWMVVYATTGDAKVQREEITRLRAQLAACQEMKR